ncbi:hypothetical protein LCGC14_2615520 [marine sediment metagenome]|uniref:Uncharacterized protein n=1 Tax=marine sediment metagenome TaxID=412755 RepID=A0A0F9CXA4_9ZZZZ
MSNKIEKHGMTETRFYKTWVNMKSRCKSNKGFVAKYYLDKGIKVSDEWNRFENFRDDMLVSYKEHEDKYGAKNTTIDRINPNGNYCKGNCRWTTRNVQANNQSRPLYFVSMLNSLVPSPIGSTITTPSFNFLGTVPSPAKYAVSSGETTGLPIPSVTFATVRV